MKHPTFLKWVVYALLGLVVLSLVPGKARGWLIFLLLLGGALYLSRNGNPKGGIKDFLAQFGATTEGE